MTLFKLGKLKIELYWYIVTRYKCIDSKCYKSSRKYYLYDSGSGLGWHIWSKYKKLMNYEEAYNILNNILYYKSPRHLRYNKYYMKPYYKLSWE